MPKRIAPMLLLLIAACAPAVKVNPLTEARYPASPVVDVRTTFPRQPHTVIAELTISRGPDAIRLLCEKAQELGADVLVVTNVERPEDNQVERVRDAVMGKGGSSARVPLVRALAVRLDVATPPQR